MDRTRVLAEMGIKPVWRLRDTASHAQETGASPVADQAIEQEPASLPSVPIEPMQQIQRTPSLQPVPSVVAPAQDWDGLQRAVVDCRACVLCKARKQAVFGVGDRQADWMFVGEGPGAEEDERGEPFVGQAGKLLDAMLASIGLKRGENVYIANAVKCRPPGNRTPEAAEMEACRPFLERQIELVKPKLLIALGRPAVQTLLGAEMSIASARGKLHRRGDIPVLVTYHPAYLLRNLPDKAKAWEDLCFAVDQMARLSAQ